MTNIISALSIDVVALGGTSAHLFLSLLSFEFGVKITHNRPEV